MPRRSPAPASAILLLTSVGGMLAVIGCKTDLDYLSAGAAGSGGTSSTAGSSGNTPAGSSAEGGAPPDVTEGGAPGGGTSPIAGGVGGTSGGEGGAGGEPDEGKSVTIVSSNGRVVATANDYGIDGEWRKFGADTSLITTSFVGDDVCIAGRLVAGNWGGGLQLVLHNGAAAAPGLVYNAPEQGLAGVQLLIDGPKVPSKVRMKFKSILGNDDYCREVPTAAGAEIRLLTVEAVKSCWMPGGAAIDPTQLENFELHMYPDAGADIVFDFCVKNVRVVPRE